MADNSTKSDMNMDFKDQLKTAYDADAQRRDDNADSRDTWKLKLRGEFADLLKREGKTTVLELGAGAGIDSAYFVDRGLDVLATDLSSKMIVSTSPNPEHLV